MKLYLTVLLLAPAFAGAATLPPTIGAYQKGASSKASVADKAVWDEYGLKDSEKAVYQQDAKRFTATAYQLGDSTAAMAAFDWQRDPSAVVSKDGELAVETPTSVLMAYGNYLLSFDGYKPQPTELQAVVGTLRNVDTTQLPTLLNYMPVWGGRVPNTERYLLGPASLAKFAPGVPPSVAAFSLSAEALSAVFHSPKGDMTLTLFSYPTNQIAMQKAPEFQKIAGAVVKRAGPLVAVILSPPDPDAAERLLAQVRYEAAITESEYVPTQRDNIGNLVINAFVLIGIILIFFVCSGLMVGGARYLWRRGKTPEQLETMITLHLDR